MIDRLQEWNRSATGATWDSWIRQYGPPEGSEATSKAYREAMRGPIMARIGEQEQRDRHHVFHGEGDTHDPISFGEGGDEAPVANVVPEGAHEAQGVRGEPELTTQAGVGPGIFGHTPEDPRVGTTRVRLQGPAGGGRRETCEKKTNPAPPTAGTAN
ncbi:hypothetical protein CYMTET_56963 [Cymbomonas tetramitiformis]|uniref:Uncharacterized protein n=1 Tax=Cymbomonas tetramitiformis TaxID=36881 RepID=A0AAE0B9V4_9CHLO|nr:hypothetical protein CYMTET_56963 [Cymbomonas tetramitiformis]